MDESVQAEFDHLGTDNTPNNSSSIREASTGINLGSLNHSTIREASVNHGRLSHVEEEHQERWNHYDDMALAVILQQQEEKIEQEKRQQESDNHDVDMALALKLQGEINRDNHKQRPESAMYHASGIRDNVSAPKMVIRRPKEASKVNKKTRGRSIPYDLRYSRGLYGGARGGLPSGLPSGM